MLGTYGHLAVRVLKRATSTVHGVSVYNGNLREPVILTPNAERLEVELSLSVFLRLRSVAVDVEMLSSGNERSNVLHR